MNKKEHDEYRTNREKRCIERMMEMLFEGKRIIIGADFEMPYVLTIQEFDEYNEKIESSEHTHCSICLDDFDRKTQLNHAATSFVNHILKDKPGLSFHTVKKEVIEKQKKVKEASKNGN